MKTILSTDSRHLSLVGQAETHRQQLPQADNLLAMQQQINRRVLHDLFKAHAQVRIARTSNQTFSALVIKLADGSREIDTIELVRQLQQWYPAEVRLVKAMPSETVNSGSPSLQIDIGSADPRLFFARLLKCANKLDSSGESKLVSDFPQMDYIDFLYYQASREIHDEFLEQLPDFESLVTAE
ncbi:MAG: hypothetical protein GY896_07820 [Gammaproteobacteria bacterium]|nr:hypothetical protein [Gammaproteobacteria bacterium]